MEATTIGVRRWPRYVYTSLVHSMRMAADNKEREALRQMNNTLRKAKKKATPEPSLVLV